MKRGQKNFVHPRFLKMWNSLRILKDLSEFDSSLITYIITPLSIIRIFT